MEGSEGTKDAAMELQAPASTVSPMKAAMEGPVWFRRAIRSRSRCRRRP